MQNKGSLQHRFDSFGADASPAVWNGIASKLDQNKRKKGLIIWWTTTGIAACLLTIFGLQFMGTNTAQNQAKNELSQPKQQEFVIAPTQKNSKSNKNEKPTANTQNGILTGNNDEKVNETNAQTQQLKPGVKHNKNNIVKDQDTAENVIQTVEQTKIKNQDLAIHETIEIEKLKREINADLTQNKMDNELAIQNIDYTPAQEPKWVFGTKIQTQIGISNPNPNQDGSNYFTSLDATSNALVPNTALNLKTNRPLTFRFELKRKNKKRLNFKTGFDVGWIYTQSIIPINNYSKSIISVGVPIKLDLNILSKKRFSLNSDFGLVNDIPILEFGKNELANESTSQNTTLISGFMGGLEMGLNANYSLNENIKISAGSGIKWYYLQRIKNASPLIVQNTFGLFNLGLIWKPELD